MRGGPRFRGWALVTAGVLLVLFSFGTSWAFAPDVSVDGSESNAVGTTLVGVQGPARGGNVTALAPDGEVLWATNGSPVGEETIGYTDVTMLENGSVLATFADGPYRECGPYEPPCKRTGFRIVDPTPKPHVVSEWSYPVRTRKDSEVHDAEPLPSGGVVVADMEYESIFVVDPTTGERTWTWNASRHYAAPADPTRTDWLHINDVDRIGEGRFLVSVRNANQLLVVKRGSGVVEVINADEPGSSDAACLERDQLVDPNGDGDVKCGDPDVLDEQHNPQWLGPGAVVVADSENDRVVELHEGAENGTWEVAWALGEAGDIPLNWPRDADRLPNGNTLITDSRNNRVVEVTRNGSLVASYHVRALPYEADRLPYAESVRQPYETSGHTAPSQIGGASDIPVLSTLLDGLRHVIAVPYWIAEGHLIVLAVSLGLVAWGGRTLVGSG